MEEPVSEYHNTLLKLWRGSAQPRLAGMDRMPFFGQEAQRLNPDIVFLSINPSFLPRVLQKHWKQVHPTLMLEASAFAPWDWHDSRTEEELEQLKSLLIALDKYSIANYPVYYGPLKEVAEAAGAASWHAFDLLPIRARFQNELAAYVPIDGPWHPTARQLFNESLKLLVAMKPKAVAVTNAYVARLLIRQLPLELQPNRHRYETKELPGVPFLMSGMLSYGVTDQFSKARLAADLRDALRGGTGFAPA